jgi:subtilisin family serine protease
MSQKGTATELGTERIGKLLMQYAIPAIIAMTASSLYNMVDSIFIGHGVGPLAISGLAITFPLMNLAAAFGSLVGVGASTLISVKLGQKDYTTAQQILGNVVSLNLIIGVLFTIVCLLFLDPILYFFGASEAMWMKVNRIGLALLFLLCGSSVSAESLYKYRVQLTDKSKSVHSLEHPETFLSERALARRASQGVAVDSTDLPVCRAYIERLESQGGKYISSSKWNNTVLMQVPDEAVALRFLDNSFVRSIKKVWVSPDSIMPRNKDRKEQVKNQWKKQDDYYGMGAEQIKIHHGDSLHLAGFKGKGIQIAVIDAGFYNVDAMKIFKNTTILGTHDFVNPSSDIYGEHNHGMKVLSCMAVNTPHVMVGTAPEASYWLLRSEDNDTEQPVEEDNWAAAVEFADSVGVDIVNTSLGYYSFDDPIDNYTYRQLDGHTSLMAASASYAAKKGLLVVCSAGNSGMDEWKKITPPADAEDILTIGAIDNMGVNAAFSSIGNTADGRIKPDVMAMGVHSAVVGVDGGTAFANGTSFASPIFCGLVACLWQACPWLTVRQLIQVVHEASDRNAYPDNIYGYGVTDMWKAYQLAMKLKADTDGK